MKPKICLLCCALLSWAGAGQVLAQVTTVQYVQSATPVNQLSTGGQPITTLVNSPYGSNGKGTATNSSTGMYLSPIGGQNWKQYSYMASFGGGSTLGGTNLSNLTNAANASLLTGSTAFSPQVAQAMQLPVGQSNGVVVLVLQRAQLGGAFQTMPPQYGFGSVISPPLTDVAGKLLTNSTGYWQGVPWTTNNFVTAPYYYSPNAGVVFATQPGQVQVTWIASAPLSSGMYSNNYVNPGGAYPSFYTNAGLVYPLYTSTYVVAGTPVKPPHKMYWTQGDFVNTGYPINVANGTVQSVHVVFNSQFPQTVTTPYVSPNDVLQSSNLLQEYRTLWCDPTENQIRAYNASGRVFVELLGPPNAGANNYQYLGFEIVDVAQSPAAANLTINLGEQITPYQDGFEGQTFTPHAINNSIGGQYFYQHSLKSSTTLFADQLTTSQNQLQIYWLSAGVQGLLWPDWFANYNLVWPADPAKYSHYVRPPAATQNQAAQTAVVLDGAESPSLDYQDPLDMQRGFITSSNTFYTWLAPSEPAHRALLRFNAGNNVRFERVFSYLTQALATNSLLAGSVATNLTAWNGTNSTLTNFATAFSPPYATNWTAYVGQTLPDPAGEIGSTNGTYGDYWAGYINQNLGNSFNPGAYVDPFANGFSTANQGAIIPVNAIPGSNTLEVLWFRQNTADANLGFQPIYWPAIVADYAIQWPTNPPLIVLANNAGSGPLDNYRAAGSIYYQNDPTLPGYNPNEEHAVMLGGQAYALRDDLNVTTTNTPSLPFGGYSSAPYVLLQYSGTDGRPAMTAYQVLRENPAAGQFFDYVVTAGTQLQAPMPLPLMALPLATNSNFASGYTNYDSPPPANSGDLPATWTNSVIGNSSGLIKGFNLWTNVLNSTPYGLYQGFTFQDRKHNFWVYRGLNSGLPPLQAGYFNTNSGTFTSLPAATAVYGQPFTNYIHVSRLLPSLTIGVTNLPGWLNVGEDYTNGLFVYGTPNYLGTNTGTITVTDVSDGSTVSLPFTVSASVSGTSSGLASLVIVSTNQYTGSTNYYIGRPPTLAAAPTPANSFTMRFYYKTLAGFAWPGLGNATNWPAVGTIVPYLRPKVNGSFSSAGDGTSTNTASLDIVYRPVWPGLASDGVSPLPTLYAGQTLTTAINKLPAVRGQDSVLVLYQQSIATNSVITPTNTSVVLFDPESQKTSSLGAMGGLPSSVVSDTYNALQFFPNLPPNLISRVWFDPSTTNLVLSGQFVPDAVNGNYVMLNVLKGDDLAAVNGLCTPKDINYSAWTNAVANLSARERTFYQNPAVPGSYVVNTNMTVIRKAGDLMEVTNSDTAVTSYALSATGPGQGYVTYVVANTINPAYTGDPVSVYVVRVGQPLFQGNLVTVNAANASPFSELITFQHTADLAGQTSQYLYDWRIMPPVNGNQPSITNVLSWTQLVQTNPGPVYTLGASGVQGLSDNYVTMRYGQVLTTNSVKYTNWSAWANPILAQGWIKRVTENIDPIAGQTQNLFENPATTTASLISLAGSRWNGDVPLNAATLTNNGLIQIYETVLNKGKSLSVNSGINYGPANQALLLAAGYLNDLYTVLGNDAWANSLNPTIEIGTDNQTYGNIATSQFIFEGEEPTLLAQNLALLRGRDDSLSPGVDVPPVYNHLWWNYTYGLAAGEVLYALNYNITDQNGDGVVNAQDAEMMYPQGHGDAYGHYLTALMNYYELLMNPNFDWVPQSEAVSILGATVQVNYQDERKFATTAAALARTGRQVFDLTWRQDYVPGTAGGWSRFATNHTGQYTYINNSGSTQAITRYWGMDHWASRVGQGMWINWLAGNSILPPVDTNPNDQGIQVVDRTTVQDLQELPATAAALENDMDNANAGFNPLGLSQNAIAFDINPQQVTGSNPQTHFEQIYSRAVQALNNAVVAFNAAQNVTADLRQQQNSLTDLKAAVTAQEQAYNNQLIELYGTPYPDDIGAGQTYPQGYTGPDLVHFMYVDGTDTNTYGGVRPDPTASQTFQVDIQSLPANWVNFMYANFDFITTADSPNYNQNKDYINFNIGPDGFSKPASWSSTRGSAGSIQTAAAAVNEAQDKLRQALADENNDKADLDKAIYAFRAQTAINTLSLAAQTAAQAVQYAAQRAQNAYDISEKATELDVTASAQIQGGLNFIPSIVILGTADGGDPLKAGLEPLYDAAASDTILAQTENNLAFAANTVVQLNAQLAEDAAQTYVNSSQLLVNEQNTALSLGQQLEALNQDVNGITEDEAAVKDAQAKYQSLVAQGNRIQEERLTFRQHTAAQVQGFTVANAAFLTFQNEDLERYTTLFNLAAQYTYLAANAYDYETGLLGTPAGQAYINQIISSSALGVIQNGQPQISGTSTGDPGLANALAEMYADWQAVKGRLGFNNPDGYGTTVSLRSENYRILPGSAGDAQWKELLQQSQVPDLLADTDVKNNCLHLGDGSGAAVPGIILTFSTTVTDGKNLFGQDLGPGDHAFSSSSFATKIFSVGVDFDGYVGMDNPVSNSGAAGTTPADPTLDPNGLAATPYCYLIPCGADSMRSPPLGDTSTIRTWNVDDVAIPLPFNIGASDFSQAPFYQAADSLSEPLFAVRKQQAFRPVSSLAAFNTGIYGATGSLQPSQYTNQRLIGRSIWNSKWKLVIPGYTLLNNPAQGLQRFINSVDDIHLYFVTYSYAGN